MLCHAPRARILCQRHYAGDMRARRRERMSKSFQSRRHHRHRRWPCCRWVQSELAKNNTESMCFFSTWRSSRPRRRMRGRSGTRRTPHAKGQNVALALAPRTCFLKVLLPPKRGAHFSLTNSSGAWGSSAASWGLLRIPGAFLGPPGTFCGLLGPPRAYWRLLGPPGASWCLLKPLGAS